MDFKRYFGKIKIKNKKPMQKPEIIEEIEQNVVEEDSTEIVEEVDVNIKKTLDFVDSKKDPGQYLKRYLKEPKYKDWFDRNYPNYTIYDAVGLSISDYLNMKRELFPEHSTSVEDELNKEKKTERKVGQPLFGTLTFTGKLPERLKSFAYQKIPPASKVSCIPSGK